MCLELRQILSQATKTNGDEKAYFIQNAFITSYLLHFEHVDSYEILFFKIKRLTLVISFCENAESLVLIGILGVTGVRGDCGELSPGGGDSSVGRYPDVGVLGEN